jgi:sulfate permease, SulP family
LLGAHRAGPATEVVLAEPLEFQGSRHSFLFEALNPIDLDYTGSQIFRRAIAELRAMDIIVALARLSDERARAQANRTGLIEAIGPDRVFLSVEEAVRKLGPGALGRARA